jgi:hypothetical protein
VRNADGGDVAFNAEPFVVFGVLNHGISLVEM